MGAAEGAGAEVLLLAERLGEAISLRGWALLSGGRRSGVMAAVSRGAARVPGHLVLGVLPGAGKDGDVADVDVALFTGMGQARNVINVLSADVVVVCGGGGAGTASEACHAIRARKPLVLLAAPPLWAAFLSTLHETTKPRLATDGEECCRVIEELLRPGF
jgi:hypothetical protein